MKRTLALAGLAAVLAVLLSQQASGGAGTVSLVVGGGCRMDFIEGWNLVSLCSEPSNKAISTVLAGLDYQFVQWWNPATQEFEIYAPLASFNPFDAFEFNQSYFIYANAPGGIYVGVNQTDDMNISMPEGWNAPAYPYNFTANISAYFNESSFYYLMKWNATAQEYVMYSPFAAEPPFTQISMGEGQLIYVYDPAGTILAYNKSALNSS